MRQGRGALRRDGGGQREVEGGDGEGFQRGDRRGRGGDQGDEQLLPPVPHLGVPHGLVLVRRFHPAVEGVEPGRQAAAEADALPAQRQRQPQPVVLGVAGDDDPPAEGDVPHGDGHRGVRFAPPDVPGDQHVGVRHQPGSPVVEVEPAVAERRPGVASPGRCRPRRGRGRRRRGTGRRRTGSRWSPGAGAPATVARFRPAQGRFSPAFGVRDRYSAFRASTSARLAAAARSCSTSSAIGPRAAARHALAGGAALAAGRRPSGRKPPPCAVRSFSCHGSESPGEWERGGGEGLHLLPGEDAGLAAGLDRGLPDRPDGQGQLVQGGAGLTTSSPA